MSLHLGPARAATPRQRGWIVLAGASLAALPLFVQPTFGLLPALLLGVLLSLAIQHYWRREGLALARANRQWQQLADQLDQMVWVAAPQGRALTLMSSAVEQLSGRPAAHFMADVGAWLALVHPEDRAAVEACWPLRAGTTRRIEYRIRHLDGGWRWVRDRATELVDADGRCLGRAGIVDDITRERLTERKLQARQQQFQGMVESAMDAVITIDARQRIVGFNRAAGTIFRVAPRKALGQRLERFMPEALRAAHAGHVERFARDGHSSRRMGQRQVLNGLRADGEAFPFEASISRFGEGEQVLMTVVLRDVSEAQASEAARRAQELAEAANRAKTEFLSRMSHELRTPLNAVLGFVQLLRADARLEPCQQEQLGQIERAGWHLTALIDDVLDVSRIEAGRVALRLQGLSAQAALAEALQLSLPAAQARSIELQADFRAGPDLLLQADAMRLRQVLLNVLSNAVKYNREGGRLRLRLDRCEGQALIEIEDSGLGLTAEQCAHLFEPFNRLGREHGGIPGTGIGLVLSRQLMQLMRGELQLRSVPGVGSTVSLRLPLAEPAPARETPVCAAPPPPARGRRTSDEPQGCVLCIEDNEVNMLLVEQLLAAWPGVRLLQAGCGEEGLRLARTQRPDLILLDMQLPDMDGHAVLAALRADAATRALPVVALSATAGPEAVAAARASGAQDYWTKPIDFAAFGAGVCALLPARALACAA